MRIVHTYIRVRTCLYCVCDIRLCVASVIESASSKVRLALPVYEALLGDSCRSKAAKERPDLCPKGSRRSCDTYYRELAGTLNRRLAQATVTCLSTSEYGEAYAHLLHELMGLIRADGASLLLETTDVLFQIGLVEPVELAALGPLAKKLWMQWDVQSSHDKGFRLTGTDASTHDAHLMCSGGVRPFINLCEELVSTPCC
jgi:hypothetical protein